MKCSGSHFSNRQVNDTSTPQRTRHFWIKSKSILSKAKSANCQSSSGGFSYAQELDNFRGEKQPRIPNWNLFFYKLSKWICANACHLNLFGNFILSVCGCKLQGCVIQFLEPPSRSLAMQHRSSPSWVTKTSRSGDDGSWAATFGRWLVENMFVNV